MRTDAADMLGGHKATAKLNRYEERTIRSYLSTTSVLADTMESHGQIITSYSYKGCAGRSMAAQPLFSIGTLPQN
jgi:hypothetical protein